jgi:hypothetical protein
MRARRLGHLLCVAALSVTVIAARTGPIEQHLSPGPSQLPPATGPIEQHPTASSDNPLLSMVGTRQAQGDDRTFTVKMEKNLTIKVTAIEEECIYSNFVVKDAPRVPEVLAAMHCVTEASDMLGHSAFKFLRAGSAQIMVEATAVEKENDLESRTNGVTELKQLSPPNLFVRIFVRGRL